jgi:large subunit ribosomal protein L19
MHCLQLYPCCQVKLGPRPWSERWERKNLKGIEAIAMPQRFYDRASHPQIAQPWRKRDLMLNYR